MQEQTAKECSCPKTPFGKKVSGRLAPYAGSDRYMRQTAALRSKPKERSKQRRPLTNEIRSWFAAEIAVWTDDPRLPLTWEAVVALGAATRNWTWSKSGLQRCPEIAAAFAKRVSELGSRRNRQPKDPEAAAARRSRAQLMAAIEQLKAENERFSARMRVWQKNAHLAKLTVAELDAGWAPVDLGQTDLELRAKLGLSLPKQVPRRPK